LFFFGTIFVKEIAKNINLIKRKKFMKKTFNILLIGCLLIFSENVKAQEDASEGGFLEHVGIGINAGFLQGVGISAHVSLLPVLKARVGVNYLGWKPISVDKDFEGDSYDGTLPEVVPGHINDINIGLWNGSVLVDYYPAGGNSIFSITAGVYFGKDKIKVDGTAAAHFSYCGVKVKPDATDNHFNGHIQWGNTVKPYLGIGLGKTIPNSHFGFRFDIGALYKGSPKFLSNYVPGGEFSLEDVNTDGAGKTAETIIKVVDFPVMPQIQFTLSYRIF
jgi:hypothetical protein